MTIKLGTNLGMTLAGIWFILTGLALFSISIPDIIMQILALVAGVLLLIRFK